jgi:hypothetical protein
MSSKALFKPFVHQKYGSFSVNRATETGNPLAAAIKEFGPSSSIISQPRFDTVLSLGCCVAQTEQENPGGRTQERVYTRLYVLSNEVPKVDDFSCIGAIKNLVRSQVSVAEVQDIVARLFANLFYVEPNDSVAELSDCRILVPGKGTSYMYMLRTNCLTSTDSLPAS